ncbi:hypothetical protein CSPX01_08457 [Colletotrichum filicis]|nr:hypothetical protein CSPX01_08457 [Colletotrichum filicis]
MATRSDAPEVRESIEAKVTKDVEMTDAPDASTAEAKQPEPTVSAKPAESDKMDIDAGANADADADADGEVDADADADGDPDDGVASPVESEPGDLLDVIQTISSTVSNYKDEDGEWWAASFQRIPNKRQLPDYFEIIENPIAFSTIRHKIQKKLYTDFPEFVRDLAQICHNAQVYNRPSSAIFKSATVIRDLFKKELQKLVAKGTIKSEEAELPDLGELPPAEDSSPEAESEEDEGEEEEEEEEEEEDDESDDDGKRRRSRRRGRTSLTKRQLEEAREEDEHKKRGRPPKVLTPLEARIHNVIKGLRKFQSDDGDLLIGPFEKLPDKLANPDYYQVITNPIALDNIKRNAKRKKYSTVDDALKDIDLMFNNAKEYNEEASDIYEAAVELQRQARELVAQEKSRPDDEFRDEDGKLPLSEIQHNGQAWRVGDWVHIRNVNDMAKPIVAQIFRTWQDRAGQRWINACWYYRPEQTVHRFEKHFFENEVAKTGQYRDHQIEEVLDQCFVMFVTRFNKGRPRTLPADKEVYVCESRYNEATCKFNKIKTWTSCVPDEVREKDYEMKLFDQPRRLKKVPSPIKHLLQADAKETDELPKPTWGAANAPPIIGAVHRRPRESNVSLDVIHSVFPAVIPFVWSIRMALGRTGVVQEYGIHAGTPARIPHIQPYRAASWMKEVDNCQPSNTPAPAPVHPLVVPLGYAVQADKGSDACGWDNNALHPVSDVLRSRNLCLHLLLHSCPHS